MIVQKKYSQLLERSFENNLNLFLFENFLKGRIESCNENDYKSFSPDVLLSNKYIKIYQLAKDSDLIPDSNIEVGLFDKALKKWLTDNKSILKNYKQIFKEAMFMPITELEEFYKDYKNASCCYCGITEKEIEKLISDNRLSTKRLFTRGRTLEIDRKDPNGKYDKNNMVFCCYWCNNAKTDEFSHEEFLPIGKLINQIWTERKKTF